MSDIFFSYVEEDGELVAQVAAGLEDAGYTTWYYERDSLPGIPFVRQIPDVIDGAQAVVVVISNDSFASPHVDREVVEAYRAGKQLIPLLRGLTHFEFRQQKRDWALMLGAAVFVTVPTTGGALTIPRIVAGLQQMGVVQSAAATTTPMSVVSSPPPPEPVSTPGPTSTPVPTTTIRPALPPLPNPQSAQGAAATGARPSKTLSAADRYPVKWDSPAETSSTSSRRKFVGAFVVAVVVGGPSYWFYAGGGGGGAKSTPTPTQRAPATKTVRTGGGTVPTPTPEDTPPTEPTIVDTPTTEPRNEDTPTPEPRITETPTEVPPTVPFEDVFTINDSGVNLRASPGVEENIIANLDAGTEVQMTGSTPVFADDREWREVIVLVTGEVGWVDASLIG